MKKHVVVSYFVLMMFFSGWSPDIHAAITLPSIFGDHMVLQQQTHVAIWGNATPNASVNIRTSWNRNSYHVRAAADGSFKQKVETPVAGGPYSITISDGNAITLNDIMIGEVWVCSGQSNMEMPVKGFFNQPITGSNEAIVNSNNDQIRLFTVSRATSLEPQQDFSGQWKVGEPEHVADFSAAAYFFGLRLNQALNVPVGLICSAWGGTRIEPWMSEAGIRNFDWVQLPDKVVAPSEPLSQQTPTVLFNGMINPMVGYGIRGAIWYQGESNRAEPARYEQLLPGLVENWRSLWGVGEFPFYYVQIAPFGYYGGQNSALLREAQLHASTAIPNIGMACLMDAGEKDCIHPANKKAAGDRLAYQALAKTYGIKGFAADGPVLKDMTVNGNQVMLTFDHASNGLTSFGKELSCFEVAGANKRFFPAKAFITREGITLFSPDVNEPVAVRYAFKDYVIGDLYNNEGLPASSFRTDNWD
jgi:sialate O-acetylesterase